MIKALSTIKVLLKTILSGAYTPLDVREFVQLCYTLAVPLVRKKINAGKFNVNLLGLSESDVVVDCLADLFRRDEQGKFVLIGHFFNTLRIDVEASTDEDLLIALRRLVFVKVNNNIIRLYSEADPALGKVLRNVRMALDKTRLFDEIHRFGDSYLIPRGVDPLYERPPYALEVLDRQLARTVLVHDNIITMLRKAHRVVAGEREFQRAIPLVGLALLLKKIYALGWEAQEETGSRADERLQREEIEAAAQRVCDRIGRTVHRTYVGKKNQSEHEFRSYLGAVRDILVNEFAGGTTDGDSYYDFLKTRMPELNKKEYRASHRKVLEYLAKKAKRAMREELRKE